MLMRMRTLNDTHGPDIERMYARGLSTTKIAKEIASTATSVRAVLLRRGVKLRSRGKPGRSPEKDCFKGEQVDKLKRLLKSGMSMADVARTMGVTPPPPSADGQCA